MDDLREKKNGQKAHMAARFRGNGRAGVSVRPASAIRVQFNCNLMKAIGDLQSEHAERYDVS